MEPGFMRKGKKLGMNYWGERGTWRVHACCKPSAALTAGISRPLKIPNILYSLKEERREEIVSDFSSYVCIAGH